MCRRTCCDLQIAGGCWWYGCFLPVVSHANPGRYVHYIRGARSVNHGRASSSTKSQCPRGTIFESRHPSHKALFEKEGCKCCKNYGLVHISSILVRPCNMPYDCKLHCVLVAFALMHQHVHLTSLLQVMWVLAYRWFKGIPFTDPFW